MARRRPALGKSIGELLAEANEADSRAGSKVPGADTPLEKTRGGINALIPTGDDFGPYSVDKADTYFQGPGRSTRVKGHMFVPEVDPDQYVQFYGRQFAWEMPGLIYVLFHKNNDIYQYGPCSLRDYQLFRESGSKGRSVKQLERFPYGRAGRPPSELVDLI